MQIKMKSNKHYIRFFLTLLLLMCATITFAHDIEVSNSDGKTIYYKYNSDGTSVSVTYFGTSNDYYSTDYTGTVVIPETITYSYIGKSKTYSVTSIGEDAFKGCWGLTSVTIPNSVTSIGSYAFSGCSRLTSVTIGNSVTSIGSYAFSSCSGLTSVTIGNSVTSIGERTFSSCSGLTSVTIGNSVTSIGSYAFEKCSGLTSVTIGNSVTSISSSAFSGCSGLKKVIVPNIKNWCSIKFGYSSANPLYYAHHLYSDENTEITKLVIPNDVTSINSYAFYGCSGLTSVTIGNSVTSIGSSAFFGCSGLTSVTIGNSVTSIGSSAFEDCSGLQKVIVPDIKNWCSIKFDGLNANPLYYAHHLYSDENTEITKLVIPNDVTNINSCAFYGCSGLTSVTIPNSVTSIGSSAFSSCSGLEKVIVPNIKNWCSIGFSSSTDNPLYYAHHLYSDENTEITKLVIPEGVTSIPNYVFSGCSGLTSVTIPNSVTSISSSAFDGCSGLKSITWNAKNYPAFSSYSSSPFYNIRTQITEFIIGDDMTSIPKYMCYGMSNLTSVTIPNSVTSIGTSAFRDCSDLTSVTIPNNVTSISDYAFSGCSGLTSVTIGNSVTSISSSAFSGCSGLKKVIVPNIKNWCSIKFDYSSANPLYYAHHLYSDENTEITKLVIPDGVTNIPNYVFSGCSGLTSVTIGNSVTSISSSAFSGCSGLTSITWNAKNYHAFSSDSSSPFYNIRTQITEFIIGDDMTSISKYMCYGMNKLKTVTIGNSVTSIGSYAFNGCSGLQKVIVPNIDLKKWCSITFGSSSDNPLYYAHHLYSDENTEITKLVIPYGVTSIPNYVFSGCSGLTSVTIPNSVTNIGTYAFKSCSGLTSVTIPNSVTSIGSYAFYGCSGLTSVTIGNSVTSIGSSAFEGCSGLTSVTIGNSVTSIGKKAFDGCSGLTSITWNVKNYPAFSSYSSSPFYDIRTQITKFIIGDDMTSIPKYMCYGMSNLESVTIPNSVTSIGSSAFEDCSGLTSVTIPNSVTSIGSYAFYNTKIKSLTIGSGIQYIASNAFSYSSSYYGAKPVKVIWLANTPPSTYGNVGGKVNYVPNDSYNGLSGQKIYPFLSSMFEVDGIKYVPVSPSERTCDAIDCVYDESAENTKIGNTVTYKNITMTVKNVGDSICSGNSFIKKLDYSYNGGILSKNFSGCSNITSITIGSGVKRMIESAFSDCKNITSVTWNAKNCSYSCSSSNPHSPFYNSKTNIIDFIIGEDVVAIPAYMCYEMSNLKSINIPDSVTSIGSSAFYGCSGLEKAIVPNINIKNWCSIKFSNSTANPLYYAHHLYRDENTEIMKLFIPDGVSSIGNYAFEYCSGLTSVTIPNSVTSIGYDAFSGCSGLKKNIVPDIKNWCSIKFGNPSANPLYYAHHLYSDENTEITKLVIPDDVTSIGYSAFSGCSGLTSVTIPNSVTSIGANAFSGCSGLTSVRFENSKDNTPVVLENNKVFSDCPLDEMYIGRKLSYTTTSSAGYSPFYKKNTLRSVKFTDKETEISDYEFYGCTNLTDVSMGDGVKSIGAYAFSGCSSLEQFTCGRQLESIGKEAFSDCTSMTKFRTRAAVPPTCGAQALDDINKWECTLYVPTESIDDYQAADQWKNFFFIEKFRVEGDSNGDDTVTMADANAIVNHFFAKGTDGFVEGDFDEEAADVNGDGEVTMADANQVVNMFLSGEK